MATTARSVPTRLAASGRRQLSAARRRRRSACPGITGFRRRRVDGPSASVTVGASIHAAVPPARAVSIRACGSTCTSMCCGSTVRMAESQAAVSRSCMRSGTDTEMQQLEQRIAERVLPALRKAGKWVGADAAAAGAHDVLQAGRRAKVRAAGSRRMRRRGRALRRTSAAAHPRRPPGGRTGAARSAVAAVPARRTPVRAPPRRPACGSGRTGTQVDPSAVPCPGPPANHEICVRARAERPDHAPHASDRARPATADNSR
jgi:hypothetical protein